MTCFLAMFITHPGLVHGMLSGHVHDTHPDLVHDMLSGHVPDTHPGLVHNQSVLLLFAFPIRLYSHAHQSLDLMTKGR